MKYFDKKTNSFHAKSNARYSDAVFGSKPVLLQEAVYDDSGIQIAEPVYEYESIILQEPRLLNEDELWLEMSDEDVSDLFSKAAAENKLIVADDMGRPVLMDLIEFEKGDIKNG